MLCATQYLVRKQTCYLFEFHHDISYYLCPLQAALDLQDLLKPLPPAMPQQQVQAAPAGAGQRGSSSSQPVLLASNISPPPAPVRDSLFFDPTVKTFSLRREILPVTSQRMLEATGGTAMPPSPQLAVTDPLLHYLLKSRMRGGQHEAMGPLLPPAGAGTVVSRYTLPVTRDELLLLYTLHFACSHTRKYGYAPLPEPFPEVLLHALSGGLHAIAHPHEALLSLGGLGGIVGTLQHLPHIAHHPPSSSTGLGRGLFASSSQLHLPFATRPLLYTSIGGLADHHPYYDHLFNLLENYFFPPDYPHPAHPLTPLFTAAVGSYWLLQNAPALLPLSGFPAAGGALGVPLTSHDAAGMMVRGGGFTASASTAAAGIGAAASGFHSSATGNGRFGPGLTGTLGGGRSSSISGGGTGARVITYGSVGTPGRAAAALGGAGLFASSFLSSASSTSASAYGAAGQWSLPGMDTAELVSSDIASGSGGDVTGAASGRFGPTGIGVAASSTAGGGASRLTSAAAATTSSTGTASGPSAVRPEYSPPLPSTLAALSIVMILQLCDSRAADWMCSRAEVPFPGGPAVADAATAGALELEAAGLRLSDSTAAALRLRSDGAVTLRGGAINTSFSSSRLGASGATFGRGTAVQQQQALPLASLIGGPSHLPPLWAGLQHGLFTFLRLHLELLLPVALSNLASNPSGRLPHSVTHGVGSLMVGVQSYLPSLVHPATYGSVVDTWIGLIAPWTARPRFKGLQLMPQASSRAFDFASAALAELRASTSSASANGSSSSAGYHNLHSIEDVAAALRSSQAYHAALTANAAFAESRQMAVTSESSSSASQSQSTESAASSAPNLPSFQEGWRHWVPLHYGFYTHCLQRFMRSLAGTSTVRVPLTSGVSYDVGGTSTGGTTFGAYGRLGGGGGGGGVGMTSGSPGADFADPRLDKPYCLEALERLLDVFEPAVVTALKQASDVAVSLFDHGSHHAHLEGGAASSSSSAFTVSGISSGSADRSFVDGGVDATTMSAQLLAHLSLLQLSAQAASCASGARGTAAATAAAVHSVLVPWAALREDAALLVKRLEVALDAVPPPTIPRELVQRVAAACYGAGGSGLPSSSADASPSRSPATASTGGGAHAASSSSLGAAATLVRHHLTGHAVPSADRIQLAIERLTTIFDLPRRVPLVLRLAAAQAAATAAASSPSSSGIAAAAVGAGTGVEGSASGGFVSRALRATSAALSPYVGPAVMKSAARRAFVSIACYVTGLRPAPAQSQAPDALAPDMVKSGDVTALSSSTLVADGSNGGVSAALSVSKLMTSARRRRPLGDSIVAGSSRNSRVLDHLSSSGIGAGGGGGGARMSFLSPAGKAALLTGRAKLHAGSIAYELPYSLRPPGPYESVFVLAWTVWASAALLALLHTAVGKPLGVSWFDYGGGSGVDSGGGANNSSRSTSAGGGGQGPMEVEDESGQSIGNSNIDSVGGDSVARRLSMSSLLASSTLNDGRQSNISSRGGSNGSSGALASSAPIPSAGPNFLRPLADVRLLGTLTALFAAWLASHVGWRPAAMAVGALYALCALHWHAVVLPRERRRQGQLLVVG